MIDAANCTTGSKAHVGRWDGATWTTVGSGPGALNVNGAVRQIIIDRPGNIYAAGQFADSNLRCYVVKFGTKTLSVPNMGKPREQSLVLFPNPNPGHFTIQAQIPDQCINQSVAVMIYNMLGQLVFYKELKADKKNLSIDIKLNSEVANGTYKLQIKSRACN